MCRINPIPISSQNDFMVPNDEQTNGKITVQKVMSISMFAYIGIDFRDASEMSFIWMCMGLGQAFYKIYLGFCRPVVASYRFHTMFHWFSLIAKQMVFKLFCVGLHKVLHYVVPNQQLFRRHHKFKLAVCCCVEDVLTDHTGRRWGLLRLFSSFEILIPWNASQTKRFFP